MPCFLSYRKKDADKAKQVIEFLRKLKKLDEAAIWYDEYLVSGDNYAVEIEEEIKKCDYFVLLITQNMIEKSQRSDNGETQDNYVIRIEYPLALKYHKPIIPINVDGVNEESFKVTVKAPKF